MTIDIEARGKRMARLWIRIAVIYLMIGVMLGIFMAATKQMQFVPVHAHVNLLGWASMALAGLLYDRWPRAGGNRLGLTHFWLHNLALPPAMVGLAFLMAGYEAVEPLMIVSSLAMAVGVLLFVINVQLTLRQT